MERKPLFAYKPPPPVVAFVRSDNERKLADCLELLASDGTDAALQGISSQEEKLAVAETMRAFRENRLTIEETIARLGQYAKVLEPIARDDALKHRDETDIQRIGRAISTFIEAHYVLEEIKNIDSLPAAPPRPADKTSPGGIIIV